MAFHEHVAAGFPSMPLRPATADAFRQELAELLAPFLPESGVPAPPEAFSALETVLNCVEAEQMSLRVQCEEWDGLRALKEAQEQMRKALLFQANGMTRNYFRRESVKLEERQRERLDALMAATRKDLEEWRVECPDIVKLREVMRWALCIVLEAMKELVLRLDQCDLDRLALLYRRLERLMTDLRD